MDNYDIWKTTPPEPEESLFHCDTCGESIWVDDPYYEIDGDCMCEECAKEWLESHKCYATEHQCFR